jgi:hemolysin activation/secretion protein
MSRVRVSAGAIGAVALGWACAATAQEAAPAPAEAPAEPVPAQPRAPERFAIEAFDVAGVTRFDADQLATIVYPFSGPDKSSADVEAARKALQDAYARRGFEAVVVDIPVQPPETFSRGIVQLAVNEAPLGQVVVSGGKYHSAERVRAQVPSLVPGQPIDLAALQRDVSAANRFPDRTITPTFKPSPTSGAVDVELKVKDELPFHASVEVNNDNSPSTTRLRVASSFRYTNLGGTGQTLSGTYIYAPERKKDSEVISGSYSVPLIGTPWTFLAYGYKSNSDIAALGGSNVLGNGVQIGLRAIYKLPADKTYQSISIGPDFKDFKQDITVGGAPAGSAPIRYVPIVAEYSLSGATEASSYDFTLGMTAGLRAIKRTTCVVVVTNQPCVPIDQFRNREIDSNENFFHLNFQGNYARTFLGDFVAAYRVNAQIADSHLITNEQYAIGGLTNVRGYYQSEAVGDDGFNQSFELRSPSAASLFGSFVDELRVYGFVDLGYAHVRSVLPEQRSEFRLVGLGGGAKLRLFQMWSGEMSIGVPLLDGPVTDAGDPRAVFVVRGEF